MGFNTIKVNDTDTGYIHSIFDVSEYNSGAIYADLNAALSAVPLDKQCGGMTIKFITPNNPSIYTVVKSEGLVDEPTTGTLLSEAPPVNAGTYDESQLMGVFSTLPSQTGVRNALTYYIAVTVDETITYTSWVVTKVQNSDNKYVQFMLMAQTFTTDNTQWQGVDKNITPNSENFVESGTIFKEINDLHYEIDGNYYFDKDLTSYEYSFSVPIIQAGGTYTITILDYDVRDILSTKGALWLKYTQNKTDKTYFTLYGGENLAGTVREVIMPSDATNIYFTGKAEHFISLNIKDYSKDIDIREELDAFEREVIGYYDTIETELHNIDASSPASLPYNFIKGHDYSIILDKFDCSTGSTKYKFAIQIQYKDDGSIIYLEQLTGNVDYSGTELNVTFPDPAIRDYDIYPNSEIRARCEGDVVIKLYDKSVLNLINVNELAKNAVSFAKPQNLTDEYKEIGRNNINAANADIVDGIIHNVITGADIVPLFCQSNDVYRSNLNDFSFVKQVTAGQRVEIYAKEYNPYNLAEFVKTYPISRAYADYMTGLEGRRNFNNGIIINIPEDGWVVVVRSTQNSPDQNSLRSFILDGVELVTQSLESRVNDIENTQIKNISFSDNDFFNLESYWYFIKTYLNEKYGAAEADVVNAFKNKFISRLQTVVGDTVTYAEGIYQLAIISDTHGTGGYTYLGNNDLTFRSCVRAIEVYNDIVSNCDAGMHGGDISCDYGTSRNRILTYIRTLLRQFRFNKPFMITKGNHDENNNGYKEVDMTNLDWTGVDAEHPKYYSRLFSTFTAVTEDTWRGDQLYISEIQYVSDKEFRNVAQHWLCPSNAVWGPGAYYYWDVETVTRGERVDTINIRFIVANSFPVNEHHSVYEDEEYRWLAQTALNFHDYGNDAQNWKVVILRHTEGTGCEYKDSGKQIHHYLSDCINAFQSGGTFRFENDEPVDFGALNGGGMTVIAHIHGHEHQNCFSNGRDYFDIGENYPANYGPQYLGNATTYGMSVWTIDVVHSVVYEDTINGHTWRYNYGTGKLEIVVGETFQAAESYLPRPVIASSSNKTNADVIGTWRNMNFSNRNGLYTDEMAKTLPKSKSGDFCTSIVDAEQNGWSWTASMNVIALHAGDAIITVHGNNNVGSYDYPITVVESYDL